MTNIITLLWGLLSGLRGTLAQATGSAGSRSPRASRVAPARPQSDRHQNESAEALILDPTAIERAMAELLSLFAQWKAGTLPPQAEAAPRYIPHPSWHPIWLRRRQPAPTPTPAPLPTSPLRPKRRALPRAPSVLPPDPGTQAPPTRNAPIVRHHPAPRRPTQARLPRPCTTQGAPTLPRPPHRAAPGQAPTPPTP